MFKEIFDALSDGEQATVSLSREGDQLVVNVIPLVKGDDNSTRDDAAQQLRSALAYPMRIKDDPEKVDRVFVPQLREYGQLRRQLNGQSETLEKMRAQAANGDKAVKKAEKKQAKSKSEAAEDKATQAETATDEAGNAGQSQSSTASSNEKGDASQAATESGTPPAPAAENPKGLFG